MQKKLGNLPQEGEVFGRLTVTGNTFTKKQNDGFNRTFVECRCECGVVKGYLAKYLRNGDTKSCGCYRNAMISQAVSKHKLSSHPLYSVFQDMKRRCYVPTCKSYPDYGGRGIAVCQEWLENIQLFFDWGMANGWEKGLYIDREKNDLGYSPDNCRFITRRGSNKNTRHNVKITAFGETKCGSEWVEDKRCKVSWTGLRERIKSGKWNIEDAITVPSNARKKQFSHNISTVVNLSAFGETKCMSAWAEDERCKVGYSGLKIRLRKGWSVEDAISIPPLRN